MPYAIFFLEDYRSVCFDAGHNLSTAVAPNFC